MSDLFVATVANTHQGILRCLLGFASSVAKALTQKQAWRSKRDTKLFQPMQARLQ